jgi:hypothetical protein
VDVWDGRFLASDGEGREGEGEGEVGRRLVDDAEPPLEEEQLSTTEEEEDAAAEHAEAAWVRARARGHGEEPAAEEAAQARLQEEAAQLAAGGSWRSHARAAAADFHNWDFDEAYTVRGDAADDIPSPTVDAHASDPGGGDGGGEVFSLDGRRRQVFVVETAEARAGKTVVPRFCASLLTVFDHLPRHNRFAVWLRRR